MSYNPYNGPSDVANFTPMSLGTQYMVGNDGFEPFRAHNFELHILGLNGLASADSSSSDNPKWSTPGNSGEYITLSVAKFKAPGVNIDVQKIKYGNNEIKYAGVPTFSDSDLVLNDYIGVETERIMLAWQSQAYSMRTQKIGRASMYKKIAFLVEFAPDGSHARQWQIFGCWPSNVDIGDFDQEGNLRQITATLVYDYAVPLDD